MQDKIADNSHFFRRTNSLAETLGKQLGELPEIIGISPRMFHGYRSGTYNVSIKAWNKLLAAEKRAGIDRAKDNPETYDKVEEPTPMMVEEVKENDIIGTLLRIESLLKGMDSRLKKLESKILD